MSAPIEDKLVGRVVGPYRVVQRLSGDEGRELYVAEHLHLDRKVALRLVAPDAGTDSAALDRFLGEARKLSRLNHENILGLVDVGQSGDGYIYLALEPPAGPMIDQVIAEHGPLSGVRARIIGRQIGGALVAAERASLLHRGVTSREIFLAEKGQRGDLVAIDFCTADLRAPAPASAPDGVRMLGTLLYQMVVGQPPVAEANEAPLDPMLTRPDLEIPTDLDVLIMRALDPDPAKRWPDIDSMLHVLAAAEKRAAVPGAEHTAGHAETDAGTGTALRLFGRTLFARPSRRALIAGGVAAAVALILIIALVGTRRDGPGRETVASPVAQTPIAVAVAAEAVAGGEVAPGRAAAAPVPVPWPEAPSSASRSASPPSATSATSANPVSSVGAVGGTGGGSRLSTALAVRVAAEAKRGGAGQGGIAGAAPSDDQAKTAAAGRTSSGDDACAVTLGARPWSEVWIDGRQAGFTPLIDYPIDCGPHEVVFKSSESDVEKRMSIVVVAGQLFKKVVDLTAPSATAGCVVTLGSRPWAEVWIDGKKVGTTPLVEFELPCGKHDVVFRSTDPEVERRETIVVQSGRPLKKVVMLVEAPAL